MCHRLARLCSWSLLAPLLISSGCDRPFFNRSTAGTVSNDEWQTHGCIGRKGLGIDLIAVCPERSADSTVYEPYIATANASLQPMNARGCCMGWPVGSVKLWGQPLEGLELLSTFVPNGANDLRFTSDGRGVAYACKDGVIVWHIDERRFETRLTADEETRFELSADCRWVARIESGHEQETITVLDFETTEPRGTVIVHSDRRPICHISHDGSRLSAVVHQREPRTTTAVVFNLDAGAQELAVPIDSETGSIVWSASGRTLATENSTDAIIQIWDMTKGELRCTAGKQSKIRCVAISPDERLIITGGEGTKYDNPAGEVLVWDANSGHEVGRFLDESSWGVTALAMTEKGMLMVGTGDGYVILKKIPDRIKVQAPK
jgi:WD40 repeat protein